MFNLNENRLFCYAESLRITYGGLAQLARALDLHSRGHRFDSDILHLIKKNTYISSDVSIKKILISRFGASCTIV